MKRNMELIRALLVRIEEQADGLMLQPNQFEDLAEMSAIGYHLTLMEDAEFIKTGQTSSFGRWRPGTPIRLTHQGHEFLDAARNESVWAEVQKAASEKSLRLTLQVTQRLLTAYAKKKLGL